MLPSAVHTACGAAQSVVARTVTVTSPVDAGVTATFRRKDGRTLHVRKATRAEPEQQKIFRALGIDPAPGGIRKMIV